MDTIHQIQEDMKHQQRKDKLSILVVSIAVLIIIELTVFLMMCVVRAVAYAEPAYAAQQTPTSIPYVTEASPMGRAGYLIMIECAGKPPKSVSVKPIKKTVGKPRVYKVGKRRWSCEIRDHELYRIAFNSGNKRYQKVIIYGIYC